SSSLATLTTTSAMSRSSTASSPAAEAPARGGESWHGDNAQASVLGCRGPGHPVARGCMLRARRTQGL
ncbi:MAG: hypothetical protein LC790_20715, partial [Actinobacteria bacterium]|nr:hypothetical protein [Actinomycetota bacterium]